MYPKTTNSRTNGQTLSQTQKLGNNPQKREQLADLLVNKFRNKYHVNIGLETDLDSAIKIAIAS